MKMLPERPATNPVDDRVGDAELVGQRAAILASDRTVKDLLRRRLGELAPPDAFTARFKAPACSLAASYVRVGAAGNDAIDGDALDSECAHEGRGGLAGGRAPMKFTSIVVAECGIGCAGAATNDRREVEQLAAEVCNRLSFALAQQIERALVAGLERECIGAVPAPCALEPHVVVSASFQESPVRFQATRYMRAATDVRAPAWEMHNVV